MTTATRIEVLDPTSDHIPASAVIAPRPSSLEGATIGLLSNGKEYAAGFLDMVGEVLADRYEFAGTVARNKGNASRPAPKDMLDELAERCDAVITASGD